MSAKEQLQKILDTYGGETASQSIKVILNDPVLAGFNPFIEYISKTWRDPFVPTLMNLSCQAVNGAPKDTEGLAVSLSLMNLSFRLWDDIIDRTYYRKFVTSFVGKYGESTALIVGGLISAKAFTLLHQLSIDPVKRRKIDTLVWQYWAKMAEAEAIDLEAKTKGYFAIDKLKKINAETINVQTCLEIGAIMGDGSKKAIEELTRYGKCLGTLLELQNDLQVSLNLTLELAHKIKTNSLPLSLLRAKESNNELEYEISLLRKKEATADQIGHIVYLLLNSQVIAQTKEEIERLRDNGVESLEKLLPNHGIEKLRKIIDSQEQIIFALLTASTKS